MRCNPSPQGADGTGSLPPGGRDIGIHYLLTLSRTERHLETMVLGEPLLFPSRIRTPFLLTEARVVSSARNLPCGREIPGPR